MKKIFPLKKMAMVILGSSMFSLALNLFIVPHGLYNGGFVGVAQLTIELLNRATSIHIDNSLVGVINLLFNIPLFIFTYKALSKKFFIGSLIGMLVITITMVLIPIPKTPILDDTLASCLIGAILGGFGVGITLVNGASGGGLDILGVYATLNWKGFSVGKLQLIINAFIYLACAFLFELPVAIYSIIYQVILSFVVDKVYVQNIEVSAMIFTKNKEIKKIINREMVRGVTYWKGMGAYTDEETEVLITIISKFELPQLQRLINDADPKAFVIAINGPKISGSYEKRLL